MENQSEAPWIEQDGVGNDVFHRGGITEVDARYTMLGPTETRNPDAIRARLFVGITKAKTKYWLNLK